jgi:WD40 repeat protein
MKKNVYFSLLSCFLSIGNTYSAANDGNVPIDLPHHIDSINYINKAILQQITHPCHKVGIAGDPAVFKFSHDGTMLTLMKKTDQVLLIDTQTGTEIRSFPSLRPVAFTPNNDLLISGLNNDLEVWNLQADVPIKTFSNMSARRFKGAFAIDNAGALIKAQSIYDPELGEKIEIWNLSSNKQISSLTISDSPHADNVELFAFNQDATILATGQWAQVSSLVPLLGTLKFWDVTTGTCLKTYEGTEYSFIEALAIHPNNQMFAMTSRGKITIIDFNLDQPIALLKSEKEANPITFNHDGTQLVTYGRKSRGILTDQEPQHEICTFTTDFGPILAQAKFTEDEFMFLLDACRDWYNRSPYIIDPANENYQSIIQKAPILDSQYLFATRAGYLKQIASSTVSAFLDPLKNFLLNL